MQKNQRLKKKQSLTLACTQQSLGMGKKSTYFIVAKVSPSGPVSEPRCCVKSHPCLLSRFFGRGPWLRLGISIERMTSFFFFSLVTRSPSRPRSFFPFLFLSRLLRAAIALFPHRRVPLVLKG